jgi:hypothetical protein
MTARTPGVDSIRRFFSSVCRAARPAVSLAARLLTCSAILAGGCGGSGGSTPSSIVVQSLSGPIAASPGAWTWIDVPESTCDDGSATGFGVNPGTSPDLVVYFNGGGACWDATTCLVDHFATHGPYGKAQFLASLPSLTGTILDRALSNNPFATATLVDIPYCTGDLHAGNDIASYVEPNGTTYNYHHTGHANALAFLSRISATWPSPRKLIIAGSSAGGFGALMNYDSYRSSFNAGASYLIDDSGPPLPNGLLAASILTDLYANWNLGALLDPLCNCRNGFEPLMKTLIQRYPNDRMSLLSSEQDNVISAYFQFSATQFQLALSQITVEVLKPAANGRYFLVPGGTHDMLSNPASFTEKVPLVTWLNQQVVDDPLWINESPP